MEPLASAQGWKLDNAFHTFAKGASLFFPWHNTDIVKEYFGPQTKAAQANFPFSYPHFQKELIFAIVEIKKAAALAHLEVGEIDKARSKAIVETCEKILKGEYDNQFSLTSLQGGAGTSLNTNVNEVIANLSSTHPNDDVNMSQSTNDVNPSALKIASIRLTNKLLSTLDGLIAIFKNKSLEFKKVSKLGRTHLQDAVPTTLGAEFFAYADIVKRDKKRISGVLPYFYDLNLGGTAIGNGINASPEFTKTCYIELRKITKLPLKKGENLMALTSSQSDFLALSEVLVILLTDLSKIASDLRLLSSGPRGGIGEISLRGLQHGSTIMPGKVNPVLPEAVNQLYFLVSGNNLTIEKATEAAQLELGVMFPILAQKLLESLTLTNEVLSQFGKLCLSLVTANEERCRELLERSTAYATLLTPRLGYDKVSSLVKESLEGSRTIRELVLDQNLLSLEEFNKIVGVK